MRKKRRPLGLNKRQLVEYCLDQTEQGGPNGECWIWPFGKTSSGHTLIFYKGKQYYIHRLVARLEFGKPSFKNALVLHKCNNPSCINPFHLYYGNKSNNTIDSIKAGTHNTTKLTEKKVKKIRRMYMKEITKQKLAVKFGVSKYCIEDIINYKTWKHVK